MKLFWLGPFLVGLTSYHIWWQRMPYTDFEGRLFRITFPWCWLSGQWRWLRREEREWERTVREFLRTP